MRRFFISPEQLACQSPILDGSQARHIVKVLRLKAGQFIEVIDGTGRLFVARIATAHEHRVSLDHLEPVGGTDRQDVEIILLQGFLKNRKMGQLVRPLSELGVDRWVPFRAHRSVAVPDQRRLADRLTRWKKIAVESAKQCRRSTPLAITPVDDMRQALAIGRDCQGRLVFDEEMAGVAVDWPAQIGPVGRLAILVGPEGGFTRDEVRAAVTCDFTPAGMGPRILKAETAAVAACALAQFAFGDMGQNCP